MPIEIPAQIRVKKMNVPELSPPENGCPRTGEPELVAELPESGCPRTGVSPNWGPRTGVSELGSPNWGRGELVAEPPEIGCPRTGVPELVAALPENGCPRTGEPGEAGRPPRKFGSYGTRRSSSSWGAGKQASLPMARRRSAGPANFLFDSGDVCGRACEDGLPWPTETNLPGNRVGDWE
jgi:hypothetical protein